LIALQLAILQNIEICKNLYIFYGIIGRWIISKLIIQTYLTHYFGDLMAENAKKVCY